MIKVTHAKVFNIDNAIIGMRNPMNSWDKSDTKDDIIGPKDMDLAHRLIDAGSPNDKFLRQILVSMQITGPLYWWKEMDTYKVATTANSTSTMHKLTSKPITMEDFGINLDPMKLDYDNIQVFDTDPYAYDNHLADVWEYVIEACEALRDKFNKTKDERYWRALIQLLPESYNQTRMWTADYETLRNIYRWRHNHKLTEWREFCEFITNELPYGKDLIAY